MGHGAADGGYLFGLAYAASWATYRLAVSMGGG